MGFWAWLFDSSGLTAHGYCLSWAPGLVGLHVGSDAVIGLSYYSIPLALAWLIRQRGDLEHGWMIYAFVAFILACGTTHLFSILTLWVPAYGLEGLVKLITALLSVTTAIVLWPLVPRLVAIPSPAQLRRVNDSLSEKIAEQERTATLLRASEARVRAMNLELEQRVAERTADLESVLAQRTAALSQRDLLLREVYHRVKNNLQVVDGFVTMQAYQLSDPQAQQELLGLRKRIYALGLVHQQLMGSADLRTFDVAPFLDELSQNIVDGGSKGNVTIKVDACPLQVGLDFAIPLGLLVTELVGNSLKHAFPTGDGNVRVTLQTDSDNNVSLVVSDDGRASRDEGSEQCVKSGLGMSIVRGLVEQLDGTMIVRTGTGTTTEIRARLPA